MKFFSKIDGESFGGIRNVISLAVPLVIANACHAVNQFVDRLMLTQYSQEAVCGAFSASTVHYTLSCCIIGTVTYVSTFVAQYEGGNSHKDIGRIVWQGIWLALAVGLVYLTGIWWSRPLFSLLHYGPAETASAIAYFQIMAPGLTVTLLNAALSAFWSGRGNTHFVLIVSFIIVLLNIPVNWTLIFGHFGFPALGVRGAAIGTVFSELIGTVIYASFFLKSSNRIEYSTSGFKLEPVLMKRLLKYGTPSGFGTLVEAFGYSVFVLVLGYYGAAVLEASSIVFSINNLAFCILNSIGFATSVLVGQAVGGNNERLARKSARSCLVLASSCAILLSVFFLIFPNVILAPFVRTNDLSQTETIQICKIMLLFVSIYLIPDTFSIVMGNALRGAGDTKFVMRISIFAGTILFAFPCLLLSRWGAPWWGLWIVLVCEMLFFALVYTLRFHFFHNFTRLRD